MSNRLKTTFAGVEFKNPVVLASGTCGFGRELNEYFDIERLGGLCSKGLLEHPHGGNDGIRIWETPSGIMNSVGLENPGVDAFIEKDLDWVNSKDLVNIVNLGGHSIEDYLKGLEQLNQVMVEGMEILDFRQIEEGKAGKAMSLVAAADYTVTFRKGCAPEGDWQSDISGFFARKSIPVTKETKKGITEVDIRPMIYQMSVNAGVVTMQLATGSAANLKPELVMEAYAAWKGFDLPEFALEVNRCEVYADLGKNGKHRFVPLNELGEVIE